MKIAIITSGFLPVPATKGGAVENLIVNLINNNEKKGEFDFEIMSCYDDNALEESKKYNRTKFVFFKTNMFIKILDKIVFFIAKNILKKQNSQSYRYIFQRLAYLNNCSKKLKLESYDKIILENHPTQYLALKWRKNNIKYENKFYYHCHNEFPGTYGCIEIMRETKKFICVSQYIADTLSKYLKLPAEKFCVLRNGIDTSKFRKEMSDEEKEKLRKKHNIDSNDKVLIFTGRIVPEKGVKELLTSLTNVKASNYKLLIIGSALNSLSTKTSYQVEVEELVKKLKKNVIFTGFVNYDEIYKYYSIANIAVLPSVWNDPAPLTVIESLVCGLPIITTNSGGIPEYATNGSAIIINRDENLINNLSIEIKKLLNDDLQSLNMGNCSRKVSKNLTIENYSNSFSKIMSE